MASTYANGVDTTVHGERINLKNNTKMTQTVHTHDGTDSIDIPANSTHTVHAKFGWNPSAFGVKVVPGTDIVRNNNHSSAPVPNHAARLAAQRKQATMPTTTAVPAQTMVRETDYSTGD